MADGNAIVLPAASWVDPREWSGAPESTRVRYLKRCGELMVARKRFEVGRSLGVDGKPLAPRKHPRPDHATGPVLAPHRAGSRTWRLMRATIGLRGGTVTLHWSHSWGRVLGYWARGEVPHAPPRDLLGFTPAGHRWVRAEARAFWWAIAGHVRLTAHLRMPIPVPTRQPLPPRRRSAAYSL